MICNMGIVDRVLRILAGIALIALAVAGDQIIGKTVVWGWIGLIPLVTGFMCYCPIYHIFGIKSR